MSTRHDYFSRISLQPATAHVVLVGRGVDSHQVLTEWALGMSVPAVDQVWLNPEGKVTIDLVREFQRDLLLQPIQGGIRLGIMSRAHDLTADAAHALLKLLEDPPAHATVILGAEQEEQLLGTIISRCHRWHIGVAQPVVPLLNEARQMRRMDYRERVKLAETWAKEDGWREHLVDLIRGARQLFLARELSLDAMRRLVGYEQLAATNVTPRLLLENSLFALGREQ